MTYLFFVNGTYWDCTRDNATAFAWLREWRALGHAAGLKFVRDDDEEAFLWLVPEEAQQALEAA
tara:strand:- start:970 stop:1161 length:192 start_codon:yes stop_codon:yes gene_type:complete